MTRRLDELVRCVIQWRRDATSGGWAASMDGEAYSLQMNDYPDEPLYTVRWRKEAKNLEDLPQGWIVDFDDDLPDRNPASSTS